MKRLLVWLTILHAVSAIFLPAALAATKTPPPGSFLKQRAATSDDLVSQVTDDGSLRELYARHFGVAENDVMARLKTLRPMLIEQPVRVNYYFLDNKGKIADKVITLPRATAVFATPDRTPTLSWPYGNPLGRPDEVIAQSKDNTTGTVVPPAIPTLPVLGKADAASVGRTASDAASIVSAPPAGALLAGSDVTAQAPLQVSAPVDPVSMVSLPNPTLTGALPSGANGHTGTTISSSTVLAGLGGLAGLVGAAVLLSPGGGSDRAPSVSDGPGVIPEPQGVVTLAIGLAAGLGLMRRRVRR